MLDRIVTSETDEDVNLAVPLLPRQISTAKAGNHSDKREFNTKFGGAFAMIDLNETSKKSGIGMKSSENTFRYISKPALITQQSGEEQLCDILIVGNQNQLNR